MSSKKIAFFVEGYTEQEFVRKLLLEIFGIKKIAIEVKKIKGGKTIPIRHTLIHSAVITDETVYQVLIYDCGGEGNVKSYVKDHRDSLVKSGYSKIIGLRDIYPNYKRDDIFTLEKYLNYGIAQKDVPCKFVLAIMEVESWFLSEKNHFLKIHASLDEHYLKSNFNLEPSKDDTQLIDEPANFLNSIYESVGMSYDKLQASIDRTIDAIDYVNIYYDVSLRSSSLKKLIDEFEEILS